MTVCIMCGLIHPDAVTGGKVTRLRACRKAERSARKQLKRELKVRRLVQGTCRCGGSLTPAHMRVCGVWHAMQEAKAKGATYVFGKAGG